MVALPLTHGGRVLFYPFAAAKPADKGGGKKFLRTWKSTGRWKLIRSQVPPTLTFPSAFSLPPRLLATRFSVVKFCFFCCL